MQGVQPLLAWEASWPCSFSSVGKPQMCSEEEGKNGGGGGGKEGGGEKRKRIWGGSGSGKAPGGGRWRSGAFQFHSLPGILLDTKPSKTLGKQLVKERWLKGMGNQLQKTSWNRCCTFHVFPPTDLKKKDRVHVFRLYQTATSTLGLAPIQACGKMRGLQRLRPRPGEGELRPVQLVPAWAAQGRLQAVQPSPAETFFPCFLFSSFLLFLEKGRPVPLPLGVCCSHFLLEKVSL